MPTSPSSARARVFRLVCVVAATIGVAAAAQTRPNLTGVWRLNYESSDEPRAQVPAGVGEDQRGFVGEQWSPHTAPASEHATVE